MFLALGARDRFVVATLVVLGVGALLFWFGALYMASTRVIPESGGEYVEGIAAQPRYVNPLLSQTSQADADLTELVYGGLLGYDVFGQLEKKFAENYVISEDGRTYTVMLRPGIRWHDGEEMTADDVVFTAQSIQDPAYKSPLRANWLSVEATAVDRYTVVFSLKKPYFGFLENLTVGILPKHIWENIAPENFLLADYNLAPVGSGPYRFVDMEKDSSGNVLSYELQAYGEYILGAPYIEKVMFHFYPDEETLIDAYKRKEVLGISTVSAHRLESLLERKSTRVHEVFLPRLFAVFFNVRKSAALAHSEVREALERATNRSDIIGMVLKGKGVPAYSAFLPFMKGYASDLPLPPFDPDAANALLDEKGWVRGEDGIRKKGETVLEINIAVPDWPELTQTADMVRSQWERVGARITVNVLGAADLQQGVIRPREYEALLFGEGAMLDSDPYSFWHSSQKNDPGLNLAMLDNAEADDLLLSARETLDEGKRAEQYRKFQEILSREHVAVFLYSPTYLYIVSGVVQGIDIRNVSAPAQRFAHIERWYINTKRVKK